MWCPNNNCISDKFHVETIRHEEYRVANEFGAWRVAASAPCCPTCGTDLSSTPPTLELSADWVTYLTSLAG